MTITVRRAREAEATAIAALEVHFPSDRMSLRSVRGLIRSKSAVVLVSIVADAIGGALVLLTRKNSRVARIYSLVVERRHRGQGLGQALLRAAERAARGRGCRELRLEVRPHARAARRLYARAGYSVVGRVTAYYGDGGDALRLSRALGVTSRA